MPLGDDNQSSLIHKAAQVFMKDVRCELKTRYGIGSVALFAVTSLVVASFAVSPYALEADTQSAFLWIVLFFSAMSGLSRSFVKEEETKTALALKLSAPPLAVYFGKLLFNLVLMLGSRGHRRPAVPAYSWTSASALPWYSRHPCFWGRSILQLRAR
ncbi:MAG: heme exporter protein CcmB [Rhodopseudomonas palustris]|nr:heme exporter protein CcmB [Rhodopseudomonas palustris]